MISVALINVTHNDRTEFDLESIKTLAESLATRGLDNSITVRRLGDEFELIAGERRLRAVKQLKWSHVRARIIEADDKTADLLRLEENILREDLSAIDKAAGIKRYIDLHGESQSVVGKRFGMTQASVSNLLRLLQLTPFWHDEIRTGKIAHTLVRDVLVPWSHRPQLLDFVAAEYSTLGAHTDELDKRELEDMVHQGIRTLTRSTRQEQYQSWQTFDATRHCCFRVTDKNRASLDCEPNQHGEERAWNVAAWDALNAPAVKDFKDRQAKDKAAQKAGERQGVSPPSKKAKVKSTTCDLSKLKTALCDQLGSKLIGSLNAKKHKTTILRLFLFLAQEDLFASTLYGKDHYKLSNAARIKVIADTPDADLPSLLVGCVADLLAETCNEDPSDCIALATMLPLDLMHDWLPTNDVLNSYTDAQLVAFAHDCEQDHEQSRQSLIDCLLSKGVWQPGYVPQEVLTLLAGGT